MKQRSLMSFCLLRTQHNISTKHCFCANPLAYLRVSIQILQFIVLSIKMPSKGYMGSEGNVPDDEEDFNAEYGSGGIKSMILSQLVPEEYLFDPLHAEPTLDNLREAIHHYVEETSIENLNIHGSSHLDLDPAVLNMSYEEDMGGMNNAGVAGGGADHHHMQSSTSGVGTSASRQAMHVDAALSALLQAADKDVDTHMARVKAVLAQDPSLLDSYSPQNDVAIKERIQRIESMKERRKELESQTREILTSLGDNMDLASPSNKTNKENITQAQVLERRLAAWERALQLYIYSTSDDAGNGKSTNGGVGAVSSTSPGGAKKPISMIELLQHLCLTSAIEDEGTLTTALEQATQMCNVHLEQTSKLLQDSVEQTADIFHSYNIHLVAHSMASQNTLKNTTDVQAKFLHHGKEALKIGHALEMAEAKRRQSEQASMLLRRWWMMENLAEQEELSGDEIRVDAEVKGEIPSSSCRMDPLFTRAENSLEASKTLKSLRTVVKCRSGSSNGNAAAMIADGSKGGGGGGGMDPQALKRFEQTDRLIKRTSAALEERLLDTFSAIYTEGGSYDFSSVKASKRPGRLDWVMLREVADALMSFDSGRSLHKRYVGLVVRTKFPDLFNDHDVDESYLDDDDEGKVVDDDVDGTRSKLSSLFHRVCEVCTEEFQLIAHVFSPTLPRHLQTLPVSNNGKKVAVLTSSSFPESFSLQVARALLQRLISDPKNGMQAQINGLLESIDRRGDFDSGIKKLDTFVVIHEKAAGLFNLLKDAARRMWGDGPTSNMIANDMDPR